MPETNLLDLSLPQLSDYLAQLGQPKFRAGQIWKHLYQRHTADFEQMTDLPQALREQLTQTARLTTLVPAATLESADGSTAKTLFALPDGEEIETVLMRYDQRRTLCISTQAGCAMDCPFCATGQMGFQRNLSTGDILAQVLHYARRLNAAGDRVTNIVFMGMGEPLANYGPVWEAIRRLNSPDGFGLGARHMTLSTVGLVPGIQKMSREPEQVGLAISLHAPTNALRDTLVPINRRFPLEALLQACRDYIEITRRRVTFEYALMDGINDSDLQAEQLAALLQGLLCHVNLIPLNPTQDSPYSGSSPERVYAFRDRLEANGLPVTVRLRRGIDIQAGCGQLRAKHRRNH